MAVGFETGSGEKRRGRASLSRIYVRLSLWRHSGAPTQAMDTNYPGKMMVETLTEEGLAPSLGHFGQTTRKERKPGWSLRFIPLLQPTHKLRVLNCLPLLIHRRAPTVHQDAVR